MIRFKDINIPKPCSVNYDSLPYNEAKRYCELCQKHVYDFRDKDEVYLNEIFKVNGKVCGAYYEDQINTLPIHRKPFYFQILTRVISTFLFVKTLLASYDSQASVKDVITVSEIDSSEVKVDVSKNFKKRSYYYSLADIYINDVEFKSNIRARSGNINLPDNTGESDKIKIIVKKYRVKDDKLVKSRTYLFEFGQKNEIVVKVNHRYFFNIFRKRMRRAVVGKYKF
jgi:hypothetical protein